jgi:hypothetical protein
MGRAAHGSRTIIGKIWGLTCGEIHAGQFTTPHGENNPLCATGMPKQVYLSLLHSGNIVYNTFVQMNVFHQTTNPSDKG